MDGCLERTTKNRVKLFNNFYLSYKDAKNSFKNSHYASLLEDRLQLSEIGSIRQHRAPFQNN